MDIDIGGNVEHVLKVEDAVKLAHWIIELAPEVDLRITQLEAERRLAKGDNRWMTQSISLTNQAMVGSSSK